MEKRKIRFVNGLYETLFCVDDGEDIELEVDGEWHRLNCRYIDDTHAYIGDRVYHMAEFAQLRERLVQRYRPAQTKKEADNVPA